eukprot:CAMPEP_0173414092 /NCGR_PEP_ID=MMETSP1356-20130122/83637_1 /TAXON_ID=77927 ORGANISM="Hemiselmis virescens, Strain PCC157" /NCGR_SAMPLE_ID=MMETSP1356 /ASSEMBLY_ACC=CAM_ASM_000847 /LENGTH=57 /DNA_ID=CAMNT_0014376211 /DNA_START=227 /DNA_END=397 /DNA_ORIENTATION=+
MELGTSARDWVLAGAAAESVLARPLRHSRDRSSWDSLPVMAATLCARLLISERVDTS